MKSNYSEGRAQPGFTLTELLVVIAVIAVLAALAVSVVSRVRGAANKAECLSNLRQLVLATLLYSTEHGKKAPIFTRTTGSISVWHREIWPYIEEGGTDASFDQRLIMVRDGNAKWVYRCPGGEDENLNISQVSYAINSRLLDQQLYGDPRTILLLEFVGQANANGSRNNLNARFALRHFGRGHVSFLDGHITSENLETLDDRHSNPVRWIPEPF